MLAAEYELRGGVEGELPLDQDNPSPFKQPFLYIQFEKREGEDFPQEWRIDVDGQIEKYINGYEKGNFEFRSDAQNIHRATPLMTSIVDYFNRRGMTIYSISTYCGSAGASHVLRNGAFFTRTYFGPEPK